ncbi:MAG: MFS transporter [Thermomicrobiales bacterium]
MGERPHPPAEPADQGKPSAKLTVRRMAPWRKTLYAIFAAQMLAIVGFSLRAPFLPFYLQDLGDLSTDDAAIWSGLINAGGAGVMALTAPIWGVVADRYGRRPMVLRAMFASACTLGLMAFATAPWHLLALRFVEGAFSGTVTASTALVAASSPKERLGFSMGLVQTAVFSGASLGPLFGGILADQIGYQATFAVASAMLAGGGLIVLLLVQERFTPQPRGPERGFGAVWAATSWLLGPLMITMIGVLVVVRFASSAVQPIIPLYVEQIAHATAGNASTVAGLTLGILGLTSAVSAIYFGRLGDRIGHRRILLACALGAGLLYLPMAIVQSTWQLIVLQGLFGVAAGGLIPTANALVGASTPPERRGALFGMTASAAALGGFFGPIAGGAIAATFGFPTAFVTVAVLLLAMTVVVWRVFARHRRSEDVATGAAG